MRFLQDKTVVLLSRVLTLKYQRQFPQFQEIPQIILFVLKHYAHVQRGLWKATLWAQKIPGLMFT